MTSTTDQDQAFKIVHNFFIDSLGERDIDSEIVNYVTESIISESQNPPSECYELVADMISGFVESFNQLDNDTQESLVMDLLHNVKQAISINSSTTATATATTATTVVETTDDSNNNTDNDSQQEPSTDDDDHSDGNNADEMEHQAIEFLLSMCSITSPPPGYLHFVLSIRNNNNLASAADDLLSLSENNKLEADIAQWQKKHGNRDQTKENSAAIQMNESLDTSIRKSIINKFHLVSISDNSTSALSKTAATAAHQKKKDEIVAAWGEFLSSKKKKDAAAMERKSNLRYRDGVVVATKGEKYVVEKPPEWDGGSRGRVKSKRKGGKGWI